MQYKIIKKKGQNKTWIEADIPCINVNPNRYNALAPAIVYVSNDVTISLNSMTSQSQNKDPYCESTWMGEKRFEINGSAVKYNFIS